MPITRAKASQLLNQKEMALYDESRANGLRRLDGKAISTRITRARAARDRARDLVRRQKLSSRADTGSKRGASGAANQRSKDKAELMADILARFEAGLREVDAKESGASSRRATATGTKKASAPAKRAAKNTAGVTGTGATGKVARSTKNATNVVGKKTAAEPDAKETGKKTTSTKAATVGKKTASTKATVAAPTQQAAKKTASRAAKSTDGEANAPRSRARKRRITPEQALAQTQALLEAKQARDQEPKPWADGAEGGVDSGTPGYQSDSAARRAKRLHAAEVRLPATQGSVSTRDRINQGKRDNRGNAD